LRLRCRWCGARASGHARILVYTRLAPLAISVATTAATTTTTTTTTAFALVTLYNWPGFKRRLGLLLLTGLLRLRCNFRSGYSGRIGNLLGPLIARLVWTIAIIARPALLTLRSRLTRTILAVAAFTVTIASVATITTCAITAAVIAIFALGSCRRGRLHSWLGRRRGFRAEQTGESLP
jgi:hypothetical protein